MKNLISIILVSFSLKLLSCDFTRGTITGPSNVLTGVTVSYTWDEGSCINQQAFGYFASGFVLTGVVGTRITGYWSTPGSKTVSMYQDCPPGGRQICSLNNASVIVTAACTSGTNTTSTASICEGNTKALTATTTDGTWSIVSGGGSISGTTYTAPAVGSNTTVTVRYTDGCGATSDRSFIVTNQLVATNTTSTTAICENQTKALTSSSGGVWSVISGGGTIAGTTYTPANVSSNTNVTIRRTIPANGGCPATTADRTFTVNVRDIATNTTSTTAICENQTKTLISSSGGTWSVVSGGGTIAGNTYTPANVSSNTNVTVRRTVPANGACPATTADRTFTVNVRNIANNTTSTATICENQTKALTSSSGGVWSVISGGGTIAGTTYTPANVSSNTNVTIRRTISANGGCPASTADRTFTVNVRDVATNTTSTAAICENQTKTLVSSSGGTWSVVSGGGTIAGNTYTPANVSSNTNVTVRRTVPANGACPATTADRTFTVNVRNIANNTTSTATICETTTKTLTGTPAGGTFAVVSGGGSISGSTYTAPSVASNTTVTISYTIAANGGCPATADNVSFTVANGAVAANTTSTAAICEGSTKALTGSPAGGTWSIQSGPGAISGTTYTAPTVSSNQSVTVRYTIPASGGCPSSFADQTFTVTNQQTATNTTSGAAICENQTKALVSSSGGTWSVVSGGGTISGNTYTPANIASNTNVTIRRRIAPTGGCAASTANRTFTVNPNPGTANNTTSTAQICETNTKTLTGTPAGGTFTIVSGGGTISGTTYTPANVASNTNVTIRYTIAAAGACPATTNNVSFTVNPNPGAAVNTTSTATICESDTKTLVGSPAGGTWSIVSGGGTISGTTYTPANINSLTSVTVRYTIAAVGACPATFSERSFNVNHIIPAVNSTSTAQICETDTKTLVGSPAGGTWSIISGGGTISGTTYTPANVSVNTAVTVRYTLPGNGVCPTTTANRTFTVNPNPGAAVNTTSTATICESDTKALVGSPAGGTWSVTAGGGTISGTTYTPANISSTTNVTVRYTIAAVGACPATFSERSFDVNHIIPAVNSTSTAAICETDTKTLVGSPAGGTWSIVSGGGTISGTTYTPANVSVNTAVTVRYTLPGNGVCPNTIDDVNFIVHFDSPPANNTTSTADLCRTDTRTLTATPSGGNWSVVSGGGTISGTTYTPPNVSLNTTVTLRYEIPNNGPCIGSSDDVSFVVNYTPGTANNTTSTAASCENSTKNLTATPAGGFWTIISGGGSISGSVYSPPAVTTSTPVTISYTIPAVGSCPSTSDNVTFNVDNNGGASGNTTATTNLCANDTRMLTGTPAGGSWSVINGGGTITGSVYTPANVTANTLATIRYTSAPSGACGTTFSDVSFTVNGNPGQAMNSTPTTDLCENSTRALTGTPAGGSWAIVSGGGSITGSTYTPANVTANTPVTIRYIIDSNGACDSTFSDVTFTVNTDEPASASATSTANICETDTKTLMASPAGGTWSVVSGGGSISGSTYTPANLVNNDTTVTLRYTIASNGGCSTTTSDVTFNVNLSSNVNNTTTTAALCETATKNLVATPTGGTWSIVSGGGNISGTTYSPDNITSNTSVTIDYQISANGACPASNDPVTFTVNNQEFANNTTQTTDLCESNVRILTGTPSGGIWSIVSGGGTISGNIYTPGDVATNTIVTIRYALDANGACASSFDDISFTVNTENIAVNSTTTDAICESATKTLVGTPTGGIWSVVTGGGTISGTTYTPDDVASNTNVTVRYAFSTNGACPATSQDVTFTVNMEEIAQNLTTTDAICESATKTLIGNPIGGTWSVVSGGGTISGNTYTPANVAVNTPVTIRYNIAANGACVATTDDATFDVNAFEAVTFNNSPAGDICESATKTLGANPNTGAWTITSGGGTISGSTYTPANIVTDTTVVLTYTIPANGACPANNVDHVFTVNMAPDNAQNLTSTDTICESDNKVLSSAPLYGTWSITSGGGAISGALYTPPSINTDTSVTIRYTIDANGTCPSSFDEASFVVNANQAIIIDPSTVDPVCTADTKTLLASPTNGTWSIISGPGTIAGNIYTPTTVTAPTNIQVRYQVTNGLCDTFSDITFTLNPTAQNPTFNPLTNDTSCIGDLVTLDGTITGATNYIEWYTNNTASGIPLDTGATITDNPTTNTTYYLFGNSAQGCLSTGYDSINIIMYTPSVNPSIITATLDTVCSGQTTTLTVNGGFLGKDAVWRWYLDSCGGTPINTGNTYTVSPTVYSQYFVRAEGLCDTSICTVKEIVIQNTVQATFNTPDSICFNGGEIDLSAYLDLTSTSGGTWTGAGVIDSSFNPVTSGIGTFSLTYTIGTSPCIDIFSKAITVYQVSPINISDDYFIAADANSDTLPVAFNDVSLGIINVASLPNHGSAFVTNNKLVYLPDPGFHGFDTLSYSVCDFSCNNTCDTATIILKIDKNVFTTNEDGNIGNWGVTPNGDGINDVLYIDNLYLYPNNKITIYNRWGDQIFNQQPYLNKWNGENSTWGSYFFILEIEGDNQLYKGNIHLQK